MARMGTCMVAGMTVAFACEVGMKAILMTRLDEAEKTHDLRTLYGALPADCRERLEVDFAGIADVLGDNRHTFDRWRYFEANVGEDAIAALVNTDRVWGLGRAARVILDECVVAGLTYEIRVKTEFDVTTDPGDVGISQRIALSVVGGEAAIPWDDVLTAGRNGAAAGSGVGRRGPDRRLPANNGLLQPARRAIRMAPASPLLRNPAALPRCESSVDDEPNSVNLRD